MTSFKIADEIMRDPTACSNLSKYIARSRCESILGQAGWMLADHRAGLLSSSFWIDPR